MAASIRENFRTNFARILDARVAALKTTQEKWAKAHGYSANKISKWKTGEAFPRDFDEVDKLATHLGVTADDLTADAVVIKSRDLDAILRELAAVRGFELKPKTDS